MSYSTRRTGGGVGRGTSATQVNYHQQPTRNANNTAQTRNPGYTTTQQSNYNTSQSQSGYSTQQGYNTTQPPLPNSQPKPAQTQPTTTAAQQPTPQQPLKQPPPPPPATPSLKQEPATPADTPRMETTENGEEAQSKPFWKRRPFVKVSNKVRKARQNAKLRRILNPKNALTFLNEMRPGGAKFTVREEMGWGYTATVDIDGKAFSGHALTSSKAKIQASEQALKHLLLEQLSKSQAPTPPAADKDSNKEEASNEEEGGLVMDIDEKGEGEEPKPKKRKLELPEDDVPWGSLAAFALHKLFAEWQKEGAEVMHSPPQIDKYEEEIPEEAYFTRRPGPAPEFGYPRRPVGPYGRGRGYSPFYPPRGHPPPGFGPARRPPPPAANYLPVARSGLPLGAPSAMLPMKKIPEDANQRHPVMLLNQLKPNLVYNESREGEPPFVVFNISVEIDGKEYAGRGKSKKEAKKNCAKAALAPLGIHYPNE